MATSATPAASVLKSLTFPERKTLLPAEIAAVLRCTSRHVRHCFEDGSLAALDIRAGNAKIPCYRVPIEAWLDWISARYAGRARVEILRRFPRRALEELRDEINAVLASTAGRSAARP